MHTLENDCIKIKVASMGAELKSLYSKIRNKEYLWQADSKWWGRSAPHLFPRIGFETNEYIQENNIVKHGYARDTEFDLISQTTNSLLFKLKDELIVRYELRENRLCVNYEVLVDFPFMIGSHPAFNIGPFPVKLQINNQEYFILSNGIINKSQRYSLDSEFLDINENTFNDDALVFINNFTLNRLTLSEDLSLSYDSEYLGIWSPPGAPFVCLEPWWIKPNTDSFKYEIIININE